MFLFYWCLMEKVCINVYNSLVYILVNLPLLLFFRSGEDIMAMYILSPSQFRHPGLWSHPNQNLQTLENAVQSYNRFSWGVEGAHPCTMPQSSLAQVLSIVSNQETLLGLEEPIPDMATTKVLVAKVQSLLNPKSQRLYDSLFSWIREVSFPDPMKTLRKISYGWLARNQQEAYVCWRHNL